MVQFYQQAWWQWLLHLRQKQKQKKTLKAVYKRFTWSTMTSLSKREVWFILKALCKLGPSLICLIIYMHTHVKSHLHKADQGVFLAMHVKTSAPLCTLHISVMTPNIFFSKISKWHHLTMMPLWMKPLRYRAGLRCGYSSVLVTWMFHTHLQALYSCWWTG